MSVSAQTATCANGHSIARSGRNFLFDASATLSEEWKAQQRGSIERYQADSYKEDNRTAEMFGNFIAVGVERDDVVLDIGCGILPEEPPYVSDLRLTRYLAIEPLTVAIDRPFPCMVGAVAERLPLASASVDAAVFATSLDHIEAEDQAIAEVLRVLKPDGRIFFWQGLYEPEMLAWSKSFDSIFVRGGPLKRAARVALAYPEYAYLLYRMWKRRRQLATGARIDDAHCRYYTRAGFAQSLDRWGLTATRQLLPYGVSSMFVEAIRSPG